MALNKNISGKAIINAAVSNWNDLASVFKVFMMAAAMVTMVYSRHYLLQHALLKGEYFVLVMLSILGMMVMVSVNHTHAIQQQTRGNRTQDKVFKRRFNRTSPVACNSDECVKR
jgi:hypothetical protein